MINSNAQYSGLANIMNMRNPNQELAYVPNGYLNSVPTAPNPYNGIPQVNSPILMNEGGMPSQQYPMQEEQPVEPMKKMYLVIDSIFL